VLLSVKPVRIAPCAMVALCITAAGMTTPPQGDRKLDGIGSDRNLRAREQRRVYKA
jgi:hypothetical protein